MRTLIWTLTLCLCVLVVPAAARVEGASNGPPRLYLTAGV